MTDGLERCTLTQLVRREPQAAGRFVRSVSRALADGRLDRLQALLDERGLRHEQPFAAALEAFRMREMEAEADELAAALAAPELADLVEPGVAGEIRLVPAERRDYEDPASIDAWSAEAEAAGFEPVGDFAVRELPVVFRCHYAAPNVFALAYEHGLGPRWRDLVAAYADGTHATWTSAPQSDPRIPPWETREAVSDGSFAELHARSSRERSRKPPARLSPAAFPDWFREVYRREMQWRAEQAAPDDVPDAELFPHGHSVAEVLAHRGEAEDWELLSNIAAIVMRKHDQAGIASLTRAERFAWVIDGMIREVNNGGFDQFFGNASGALAYDLVPALQAVGSQRFEAIAREAMRIFGPDHSLDDESRWSHLEKITSGHQEQPWEACDARFYECEEPLETLTLDYVARTLSDVGS